MSKRSDLTLATTHEVRDTCLCLHVQRAARALARRFDNALRPVGLTNGQFSLMISLNRPVPPSIKDVAALLGADRTTITASLKALERRGLVATEPDPQDRRSRLMRLTPAGRKALSAALPIWRREHAALAAAFAGAALDRIRADLRALSCGTVR